jgi:hypothetical protein
MFVPREAVWIPLTYTSTSRNPARDTREFSRNIARASPLFLFFRCSYGIGIGWCSRTLSTQCVQKCRSWFRLSMERSATAETHKHLVDVEQEFTCMFLYLSVCILWPLTSQPCCVSWVHEKAYLIVVNLILRWYVSRKLNVSGAKLCIAPRGLPCPIELHSIITRYCCLQA